MSRQELVDRIEGFFKKEAFVRRSIGMHQFVDRELFPLINEGESTLVDFLSQCFEHRNHDFPSRNYFISGEHGSGRTTAMIDLAKVMVAFRENVYFIPVRSINKNNWDDFQAAFKYRGHLFLDDVDFVDVQVKSLVENELVNRIDARAYSTISTIIPLGEGESHGRTIKTLMPRLASRMRDFVFLPTRPT